VAETTQPPATLSGLPGIHDLEAEDGRVRFDVDAGHLDTAVKHLAGLGVRSLTSHPPTLEQLLLRHYGDDVKGEDALEGSK
jgi:ABC-2 type transport system ATP-binding protein